MREEVTLVVDEALVFRAELEGLRLLANLPRPKVTIRAEDVPGASCLWETNAKGGHRDAVRLIPHSGVPLKETLAAIQRSQRRSQVGISRFAESRRASSPRRCPCCAPLVAVKTPSCLTR